MTKAKIIVFDLFATLIHDISFNFSSGLRYLYENILTEGTDQTEFLNYANTYWKDLYDKRAEDNSEVSFEEELLDFKYKYGFKVDWSLEEIQYHCMKKMNENELFEDTLITLEKLKSLNIPVYLLSNSIFKKYVMQRLLLQFELEKYFEGIYFSADYKVRKPHKEFFQVVMNEIKKHNKEIHPDEIFYIGDNYKADVLGAANFGFTPVFLNRNRIDDINKEDFKEITSLLEVLEYIN
jgi:HAD superfamily hydrolase (TIGR01549 family)